MKISSYLPHDVIESCILIRLPVKSLLRLQAVCKRWSATISDPIFADSYLQRQQSKSKNSTSCSFFVPADAGVRRAVLENEQLILRELPPLQYYPDEVAECRYRIWCYCDGVFLISRRTSYVVWNPSRRAHIKLVCPYDLVEKIEKRWETAGTKYWERVGIYYHSAAKDYRVVVVGDEHNAVYSCKNKSWSEKRSNSSAISFHDVLILSSPLDCVGVPYKESIYWAAYGSQELGIESQIVCFDGEDETLKIVCKDLDPDANIYNHKLFTSRDGLYLISMVCGGGTSITKILPEWRERKFKLPTDSYYMVPLAFTPQDNKVIFMCICDHTTCLLYDYDHTHTHTHTHAHAGTATTTIQLSFNFTGVFSYDFFPCIQTLFLL